MVRQVIFYENYFFEFYNELDEKVQEKIDFVLDLISNLERVPSKFLQHLKDTEDLYEIRVKVGTDIYRIFCFFDEGKLIVLINGFQKKSQKTPRKELKKAEKIKREYFLEMKGKSKND